MRILLCVAYHSSQIWLSSGIFLVDIRFRTGWGRSMFVGFLRNPWICLHLNLHLKHEQDSFAEIHFWVRRDAGRNVGR